MYNQEDLPSVERESQDIWTPNALLHVPHEGREIIFAYPSLGPGQYRKVGREILSRNLLVPAGDYTASLLHSAYCSPKVKDELEFQNARLKNISLYVFNRNLWTEIGVYVVQDNESLGSSRQLNECDLEKMLEGGEKVNYTRFSKDRAVRFAPKGSYHLGVHTPESFSRDGFIIASFGVEGAQKLGEVAGQIGYKMPYVFGLEVERGQRPVQRLSAIKGVYSLYFLGDDVDHVDGNHAFGILK